MLRPDLVLGAFGEDPRPLSVEGDEDRGRAGLLVDSGCGVDDGIAGEHELPVQQHRAAVALAIEARAGGHPSGERIRHRVLLVHHPELEGGGGPEDVLGAGGVLDPRELDDDPVVPLALDHRLRHPELVHPVAQCRHVLLERELLGRLGRLLGEDETQPEVVPEVLLGHPEIRELAADSPRRLLPRLDRAKPYQDPAFGLTANGVVSHAGLPQERAHVAGVPLLGLGDRGRHVDLHEEVHPTPEVEAEVHRQQTRRGKPPRHGGSEVQGDDVAGAEVGPQEILGLELDFGVAESGEQAALLERHRAGGNPRGLEGAGDPRGKRGIDGHPAFTGNLHRRILAEHVREGEDDPRDQHGRDEKVLPERVAVGHGPEDRRGLRPT